MLRIAIGLPSDCHRIATFSLPPSHCHSGAGGSRASGTCSPTLSHDLPCSHTISHALPRSPTISQVGHLHLLPELARRRERRRDVLPARNGRSSEIMGDRERRRDVLPARRRSLQPPCGRARHSAYRCPERDARHGRRRASRRASYRASRRASYRASRRASFLASRRASRRASYRASRRASLRCRDRLRRTPVEGGPPPHR